MTPEQFVAKWSKIRQKETAVAHSHFNDVCRLVNHPVPTEYDPEGKRFSFETKTVKPGGGKGFADVFFKDHFIWEYKGVHKNLDKAFRQLQLYREHLQNPPLLITSDTHQIIIHTNFNNYPVLKHRITFDEIISGNGVEMLRWAFFDPDKFKPAQNQQEITEASAETFIAVADEMKKHQEVTGETYTPEQLAHFMVRLLFTLFAEDMELLPHKIFTKLLQAQEQQHTNLRQSIQILFREMRAGGMFGMYQVRHFDGTLFDDDFVPIIPDKLAQALLQAADQKWTAVDPSIFGTLFERVIDESKRSQLGAHYTNVDDIMLIVGPVLMAPLKEKWETIRRQADRFIRDDDLSAAHAVLAEFSDEIGTIRVLDPACGSGNFLYVALRELLDLQKTVISWANRYTLPPIPLTVTPQQLYGIEINVYAHELAQITTWIGYLQWRRENGFDINSDPILRPLHNIKRMDAILAYDEDNAPIDPQWPAADVIMGNPPFLGGNKIRQELGDATVDSMFTLYDGRVPAFADLVCYWFEKARMQIQNGSSKRAGLLATNSIRGGVNRTVLERIKESGDIFMAWSDNPWVLEGASVRISIIGFDDGGQSKKRLDGSIVPTINPDLTKNIDLTNASVLKENNNLSFMGMGKKGHFDIPFEKAKRMLNAPSNPSGVSNKDVIRPSVNGLDITRRPRNHWIIDFGVGTSMEEAAQYEAPFAYVRQVVKPFRDTVRRKRRKELWWIFGEPCPNLRAAIADLSRFIVTPAVAKHRLFVWLESHIVPDSALYVFARDDDYFFGVLHSKVHELWSLRKGTSLEDRPRYTGTTTFETFPFPWIPGQEPSEDEDERAAEIAFWARELVKWRQAWLNPPRNGMNGKNGGVDTVYEKLLKKRTLTNLYNGLAYYRQTAVSGQLFNQDAFDKVTHTAVSRPDIMELNDIHAGLDTAVLSAYNWPSTLNDEQILERLLRLNQERARQSCE